MAKKNLKPEIIRESRELFETQGYAATTVRQIAKKLNCTAGSLYYFFEGGKAEILQAVVSSYGIDPEKSLAGATEKKTLDELIDFLVDELTLHIQKRKQHLNWLTIEISQLNQEETAMIKNYPISIANSITTGVQIFVEDPEISARIARLIYSSIYGYVELKGIMNTRDDFIFDEEEVRENLKMTVAAILHKSI